MKKKNFNNWYTTQSKITEDTGTVTLNVDLIRSTGKEQNLKMWVKQQEIIAVKEERFEDACNWRDFPEHGIVYVDCDKNNIWKIVK